MKQGACFRALLCSSASVIMLAARHLARNKGDCLIAPHLRASPALELSKQAVDAEKVTKVVDELARNQIEAGGTNPGAR